MLSFSLNSSSQVKSYYYCASYTTVEWQNSSNLSSIQWINKYNKFDKSPFSPEHHNFLFFDCRQTTLFTKLRPANAYTCVHISDHHLMAWFYFKILLWIPNRCCRRAGDLANRLAAFCLTNPVLHLSTHPYTAAQHRPPWHPSS